MRFAAILIVLAAVAWLTLHETTGAQRPGSVTSASQAQSVVDSARRHVAAATR